MDGPWSDRKEPDRPLKIEPWFVFGVALVVAVAAVLFGVATWVIQSEQARRAIDRAANSAHALALKEQELAQLTDDGQSLRGQLEEHSSLLAEARNSAILVEKDLRAAQAELEAVKRERDDYKATLADDRRKDAKPDTLPVASLVEALGSKNEVAASVFIEDDGSTGMTQGAMLAHLQQEGRMKCGFDFEDSADIRLSLTVVAASSMQSSQTALSVSLSVATPVKIPGEFKQRDVILWQRHTAGLCSRQQAPVFAEDLVDNLLDALKVNLQP